MSSFPTPVFLDLFCKIIITDILCNIRKINSTLIQPEPIKKCGKIYSNWLSSIASYSFILMPQILPWIGKWHFQQ